ncbi:hypothetical protein [Candidatus Vidania fulgoroideorum]
MRHLKKKFFVYFKNKNKIKNIILSLIKFKKVLLTKKISKIVFSYLNKLLNSYFKKNGKKKKFINKIIKKYPYIKNILFKKKSNYLKKNIYCLRKGDLSKMYVLELI